MREPKIHDTVRFRDHYNGNEYTGVLIASHPASRDDWPVWECEILTRKGKSIEERLVLNVMKKEIVEIIDS